MLATKQEDIWEEISRRLAPLDHERRGIQEARQ